MGKKNQRKKANLNQSALSLDEGQNSSCDSFTFSNTSFNDGIIPEKFLVSSVKSSGFAEYLSRLKFEWKDSVFLHPSVLKAYNVKDLVLIKSEQRTILCTAYSLPKLKKTLILFPNATCVFKPDELVSLCNYERQVKCAEEITISFDNGRDIDEKMKYLILQSLCNRYIHEGLSLQCKLFDQSYHVTIEKITCSLGISDLSLNCTADCHSIQFYTIESIKKIILKTSVHQEKHEIRSSYSNIGGLQKQFNSINKYIQIFLNANNYSNSVYCGTLILDGPSGIGKTLLLEAVLNKCNVHKECIIWYKLCSLSLSDIKKELKFLFKTAVNRAPSIIVIDEFNHLCPSKNKASSQHQYISKIVSQFIETLDEFKVMIIAVVNDSDYDSSILQTSKRLIEVVKFPLPAAAERLEILKTLLKTRNNELTLEDLENCARSAHGFTGKDLLLSIENAQMLAFKRQFSSVLDSDDLSSVLENKDSYSVKFNFDELKLSLKMKKSTIVAAGDLKVKKVKWDDIGGMTEIKEKLKQLVEWPLKHPEAFKLFNITPSRGVLMYGPPGCSKTMIAKALASECELNFISKNASDLFDKYVGESERAVRDIFATAKAKSPCIIFLDEIDALVAERGSSSGSSGVGDRIVTTLLTEMDGIEELQGVIIIAATNRPDMLDDALVRNGRINHFIYVPLPDADTREAILKLNMKNRVVAEDFDFLILKEKTEGYSGAEIVNLCNEAALQLLAEDPNVESPIFKNQHFERALKYVLPRTNKEIVNFYEKFNKKHCLK